MVGMFAVPGTSTVPAASGLSAYRTKVVHIALARPQVTAKYQRFGSIVSMAPEDIAAVRVPLATPGLAELLAEGDELPEPLEEQAATRATRAAASASGPRMGRRDECAISFSDRFIEVPWPGECVSGPVCRATGPARRRGHGGSADRGPYGRCRPPCSRRRRSRRRR